MKAIFLDIDGVVATSLSVRLSFKFHLEANKQLYDPFALYYLGRLVRKTGARIVLSSNWRMSLIDGIPYEQEIMDNLFKQLKRFGAPITSYTPFLPDGDRSSEIGAWLDEHPCESWVIFDDMATFEERPEITSGHLIIIEDSDGIRRAHFKQALKILR